MIRIADVALVQDALPFRGGAEQVLEAALEVAPHASIYTAVYGREHFIDSPLGSRPVQTSFIDRLPGARTNHYRYAPLFPWAMERLDLRDHDLILSFSYAFAHGVVPDPEQLHVSYVYTPLRYAWRRNAMDGMFSGPTALAASALLHYLRLWDVTAAARVDHYITVSEWIARGIRRAYRRDSEVIYPPVDVDDFRADQRRADYYVAVTRLAPHKRVNLLVEAFSRLGYPLYIIGDGPEHDALAERAGTNIQLLRRQPRRTLVDLLSRARAFVHAAEEDFGIAMVEAQAAGCPVIAYGKGASPEIVRDATTGLLFAAQNVDSIVAAVGAFTENPTRFDSGAMQHNAQRFRKERFQQELENAVERAWTKFKAKPVR